MTQKQFLFNILLLILSAVLVSSAFFTLSFTKISFGTVIPFSLIPLFVAIRKLTLTNKSQSLKEVFKKSILSIWFFGFVLQLISFFWITKPLIYFGGVPPYLAYPLFMLMSVLSSTYFLFLFSPYIFYLGYINKFPNKKIYILPVASTMTLFEIILPRFFDWSFGSLLSSNLTFIQLESLFGFNTGSLFIFYLSLLISSIYFDYQNYKSKFSHLLIIIFTFVIVCLFGQFRIHNLQQTFASSPKLRIAFIQPNFTFNSLASLPLPSKDSQRQSFTRMLEMSEQVIQKSVTFDGRKPNLIVWPESTAPDFFLLNSKQIDAVTQISKKTGIPFLIQTVEIKPENIKKLGLYNAPIWSSSVIVNSNGLIPSHFQKWIPMPFGEEFPLESKLPIIGIWYRSLFKNASKLERGSNYHALPISEKEFVTPLICFDSINQQLSYLSTKKGKASFLVNQANFAWMVNSNAGHELAILDQMRAIENGKSMVVASNTGPSLAFDPLGQLLLSPTELLTQNINFVDIPLYTEKTLFQTVYYWPLVILGSLSLCYFILLTLLSL